MLSVVLFTPSSELFVGIHLSQATAWFFPDSVEWTAGEVGYTVREELCTLLISAD